MKTIPSPLVFATANPNKLKEVIAMLPPGFEILSLDQIGCKEDIPETSSSIEGNARQKAQYLKTHYKHDCFADDTGLEVEALGDAPGVHSARYAGPGKNDRENVEKLLREMNGCSNRRARFKTVIALHWRGQEHFFTGICHGRITNSPSGESGFGYDPVFIPEGQQRTFAQMSLEEKSRISHRALAFDKLVRFLAENNS